MTYNHALIIIIKPSEYGCEVPSIILRASSENKGMPEKPKYRHNKQAKRSCKSNEAFKGITLLKSLPYSRPESGASPPYLFGSSFASMRGNSSGPIVFGPVPIMLNFSIVFAGTSALNNQKTHAMSVGTLMKNFFDYIGAHPH